MLLNTFSRNKRRQKLWSTKMVVSKCPCLTFGAAMSCLDAISHWFLAINSEYLQPYWPLQHTSKQTKTDKATKPQRYISLDHWHISSMTEKELYQEDQNMRRHTFMITKKICIWIICCAFHLFFSKGYFYSGSFQGLLWKIQG